MKKIALVLSGGSARGAYEVGVLKALLPEINKMGGFKIICGTSVGSVNACFLSSLIHLPTDELIEGLEHYWLTLKREQVFIENWAHAGLRSFLSSLKLGEPNYSGLLDNTQLNNYLKSEVNWNQIHKNINDGLIYALTITATAVNSGRSVVFYESADPHCIQVIPTNSHTRFVPDKINYPHALASSSIPIFFKPELIKFKDHDEEHSDWFFDGGVRQNTPLLPALTIGADALVIIGLHFEEFGYGNPDVSPGLLQNIGKLLNAIFLDHIRYDTKTLNMVNEILEAVDDQRILEKINHDRAKRGKKKWRVIPDLYVSPSKPISDIAEEIWDNYPDTRKNFRTLEWLFKLGNITEHFRGDILSYFFFNPQYAKALIDMGYEDGLDAIKRTVWDPHQKKNVRVIDKLILS